jgi:hypothetical protein
MDHVAEAVVGLAGVDVVDVAGRQRGEMTALLAFARWRAVELAVAGARLRRAPALARARVVAPAGRDAQRYARRHQQRENPSYVQVIPPQGVDETPET